MKYYIFSKYKSVIEYSLSAEVNTPKDAETHMNNEEYFGDPNDIDFIVIKGERMNVKHVEKNIIEEK